MESIDVQEVKKLMDAGESFVLLDIREHDEVEYCHIANSTHIPMNSIPARTDELDPGERIIVYCHTGRRSMQVCHFLERQGFSNVSNLHGGIHAWSQQIDPSVPTY